MPPNVSDRRDQQNFNYIIRSGLAGGVAGCVAKTVVAPLDRVKILFQASNPDYEKYAGSWSGAYRAGVEIYRGSGVRGLFQGHSATLLRIFPYAAIKYMAYDQVHHMLMPTRQDETNFRRFVAGSMSGAISVFITYPLDVIRVRLAYQTHSSTSHTNHVRPSLQRAISDIYRESTRPPAAAARTSIPNTATARTAKQARLFTRFPLLSFYRGFSVTLVGMVPYAGTSFVCWGYLRARFLPGPSQRKLEDGSIILQRPKATPVADLVIGAVAGMISQTASYPFEIVRRRQQVGGLTRPDRWLGFRETVSSIWTAQGWRGFFVGLSIGYLKVVPMTAVSFAVWQWGKQILGL